MFKKIIITLLSCCLIVPCLTGCFGDKGCFGEFGSEGDGSMFTYDDENKNGNGNSGDNQLIVSGDEMYVVPNEFRFAAYSTPPNAGVGDSEGTVKYNNNPNYNTEEHWNTLKAGGFNWGIPIYYDQNDEHILQSLEMSEKAGVKILITNYDASPYSLQQIIKQGGTYTQARRNILSVEDKVKEHIEKFRTYKSFGGIFAADEPSTDLYPAIAAAQDWFEKNYPAYEFYVNLLPNYAQRPQLFGSTADSDKIYEDYVSDFVDTVNPFLLSYDHYPIIYDEYGNKKIYGDTIYNMVVFAEQARRINIPWFIYLQTMKFEGNTSIDYYEEYAWQCYASLACGVKGIQNFCYWTLLSDTNNIEGGMVDRDGTPRDLYYWSKDVFDEIKFMESAYMSYNWEGVKYYTSGGFVPDIFNMLDENSKTLSGLAGIYDVQTDCDTLIGQFDKNGNKGFMVVNLDEPFYGGYDSEITLNFASTVNKVEFYYRGEKTEKTLENHSLTLNVAVGEGCFVLPL